MFIRFFLAGGLGTFSYSLAQPPIAPTDAPVGSTRGEDYHGYNVLQSFELGYRWHTVGGNDGKYRSDVNYRNGVRLLQGNIQMNSRDGHGTYFDELLLNTVGLGNDPYQFASFRIQKNRLYRYDLTWRLNEYYNPALTISNGEHFIDTSRRLQDHSLVLLPQSAISIFAGFADNTQNGPALTTIQLFDNRGDEFPLFENIRRQQTEYRVGAQLSAFGYKLSFLRTWEFFKDDTTINGTPLPAGNNPADRTTLTSLRRSQPYHGETPGWRVYLIGEPSRLLSVNGRFTYSGSRRDFIFDENVLGADRTSDARRRQTLVIGTGTRPVTAANLTLSLFPHPKLTVANHTAFNQIQMTGNGVFSQFDNGTSFGQTINFEFLGIRTIANFTDLTYRANNSVTLFAGYHFSTRRIRSTQLATFEGVTSGVTGAEQENTLHSGLVGVRLRPIKPLTLQFDAEIGRADRPVFPISDRNYHALTARIQYKMRNLLLSASTKTYYNTNSVSFSAHSSRARTYTADASWTPRSWLSFDLGYNKLHLDTNSGIAYFFNGNLVGGRSIYISNIHAGNAGVRFQVGPKVDLFVGFSRVQDAGDGRPRPPIPVFGDSPFFLAQTFPLAFTSPSARLSVRLKSKLRWNVGYQHYNYHEDFFDLQNYRAHTGYSSLSWAF